MAENNFGGAALILAMGLGIAAIIFAGGRSRGAEIVTVAVTEGQSARYEAVITNLRTGTTHGYLRMQWPSADQCEAAIAGIGQWLNDIVGEPGTPTREATEAEPHVKQSVEQFAAAILLNTGRMPRLRIDCKLLGDPA